LNKLTICLYTYSEKVLFRMSSAGLRKLPIKHLLSKNYRPKLAQITWVLEDWGHESPAVTHFFLTLYLSLPPTEPQNPHANSCWPRVPWTVSADKKLEVIAPVFFELWRKNESWPQWWMIRDLINSIIIIIIFTWFIRCCMAKRSKIQTWSRPNMHKK